tara:strand:- start:54 stop:218 length:165 start_codon:yes stop_codon:yes gene_type:complete
MIMYKLWKSVMGKEAIIRTSDGACIPFDNANTDYQQYLEWVSQGNQPEPAEENE